MCHLNYTQLDSVIKKLKPFEGDYSESITLKILDSNTSNSTSNRETCYGVYEKVLTKKKCSNSATYLKLCQKEVDLDQKNSTKKFNKTKTTDTQAKDEEKMSTERIISIIVGFTFAAGVVVTPLLLIALDDKKEVSSLRLSIDYKYTKKYYLFKKSLTKHMCFLIQTEFVTAFCFGTLKRSIK